MENDFHHHPKGDSLLANTTCLSGAAAAATSETRGWETRSPGEHGPSERALRSFPDSLWPSPHAPAAQGGKRPGPLPRLSFNWSDKPARPGSFRAGTALLGAAGRRQAPSRPGPHALPTATCQCTCSPCCSRTDSAREGTANHCRPCQTRGFCDVGRCLQRPRARPDQRLL